MSRWKYAVGFFAGFAVGNILTAKSMLEMPLDQYLAHRDDITVPSRAFDTNTLTERYDLDDEDDDTGYGGYDA